MSMDEHIEPPAKKARFAVVNNPDIGNGVEAKVPGSTKTATLFWMNVFKEFCETSGIAIDLVM